MTFVFVFLLCISLSTAVVCGSSDSSMNETLPDSPQSMASCDNVNDCRTLSDIVYGCLATVFACVWVAVHPNIPRVPNPTQNWRHQLSVWVWTQFMLMYTTLLAILVPEWLLVISSEQWSNAHQAAQDLREASRKAGGLTADHCWTTTHGFLVIMGGFQYFDGDIPLHPLSRDDVERLVKAGILKAPLKDEISALSKAGSFAKACALLQTLWFVAQCGARAKEQLPLTQLEIITLAYTTVTMGMYIFWWKKPLNVDRPIPIQRLKDDLPSDSRHSQTSHSSVIQTSLSSTSQLELKSFGTAYPDTESLLDNSSTMPDDEERSLAPSEVPLMMFYTAMDTASDQLSTQSDTDPIIPKRITSGSDFSNRTHVGVLDSGPQRRLGRRQLRAQENMLRLGVVASLVVAFGGIHLLSWDAYFPSTLDRHLWRASTLFIVASGGVFFAWAVVAGLWWLLAPVSRMINRIKKRRPRPVLDPAPFDPDSPNSKRWRIGWVFLLNIYWAFYGAARILMLFVCVRTLNHLPMLAYRTVTWTTLLPHV